MASRRKFSDEYKREAVRLAIELGVTMSQVGRELGINANMLGRWGRDDSANGGAAFLGQGKPRDEEMVSLKRELARVRKDRYFPKEAAAYFTSRVKVKFRTIERCREYVDYYNEDRVHTHLRDSPMGRPT